MHAILCMEYQCILYTNVNHSIPVWYNDPYHMRIHIRCTIRVWYNDPYHMRIHVRCTIHVWYNTCVVQNTCYRTCQPWYNHMILMLLSCSDLPVAIAKCVPMCDEPLS